jgi:heme-degrading monooxygenase HmoA
MSPTVPTTVTVFAARHRLTARSPDARSAVSLSPEWSRVHPPGGCAARHNPGLARSELCHAVRMIVEHVVLPVIPGREDAFETDFAVARKIISAMPGFIALTLSRQLEQPNLYLLLVEWERLEDHTVGFRGSAEYEQWRKILHPYYDPFPEVTHFAPIA